MSQREKAGLSWPGFSVAALDPFENGPEVKCACLGNWSSLADPSALSLIGPVSFQSRALGVVQATSSTVFLLLSLLPAALFPFCAGVPAIGVGQPANCVALCSVSGVPRCAPVDSESSLRGVGHEAVFAITCSDVIAVLLLPVPSRSPIRRFIAKCASGVLLSSFATGVGHPEHPLSLVRGADAASRQICRRNGVLCAFQISANMVEPRESRSSGNLLAKDAARAALADEVEERRP